jgi:hypothetical protein
MKRYLLLLLPVSFLFSGCGGWMRYMEDRVIGSWRLSSAAKHQSFKKDPIYTGYEPGIFYFYDNGQARYSDGGLEMEGSWQLRYISNSGYDINGNSTSNSRTVFTLHLVNFQSNKVLNLDFDDFRFNSRDRFTAEYETFSYYYRYIFERY